MEEDSPAITSVFRWLEMNPMLSAQLKPMHQLLVQLLALDRLLSSAPLQQQRDLDLEAILSAEFKNPSLQKAMSTYTTLSLDFGDLYKVLDTVPRFDLIPATLVYICRSSWQGRTYENAYCHSDFKQSRDPTCSEVLQLLPKLDQLLRTSLNGAMNAILGLVPPFRFLDLPAEIRLQAYTHILPRQPYLVLINVEPRRHALHRYDLTALRVCRHIYSELVQEFYKDQVLVMNVYDLHDYMWAFIKTSPRDHLLVFSMRKETRALFKRLEIRILDMEDPNANRKGLYWEAMDKGELLSESRVVEIFEAFPNLESITVSFEIEENNLRYWTGWSHSLVYTAEFLFSILPQQIEIRWDFQPTSHPDLQELSEIHEEIMDDIKRAVTEETAKKGGRVQLGTSIIKEPIARREMSE